MSRFTIYFEERKNLYYIKNYDETIAMKINISVEELRDIFEKEFNGKCENNCITSFSRSEDIIKAIRWIDSMLIMDRLKK